MAKKSDIQDCMQDLEALSAYVQEHLNKPGVSTHSIADKAGGGISHGTVWNIARQHVSEVKGSTLAALARGLGVSLEEVQAVVRGKPVEYADPFDSLRILFHGWEEASEQDRREVMGAISLIGEAFRQRILQQKRSPSKSGRHTVREEKPGRERKNTRETGNG